MKIKKNYLIVFTILSIIFGSFFRLHNLSKNMEFTWDQETTATKVLEMFRDKKPLLIGPRVGPAKFFLPPFYYYLTAVFLLITKFDPIGLYYCSTLIGIFTGLAFYFFSKEIFDEKTAFLTVIIYFLSPLLTYFDRLPWNVNLLILASLLTFLGIFKIFIKNSKQTYDYFLLGLGMSLGIHAHLTALFFPVVLFFLSFIKKKFSKKMMFSFLIVFISCLSLVVFDLRHGFFNFKAVLEFLGSNSDFSSKLSFFQRLINNFRISFESAGKLFLTASYHIKLFFGMILAFYVLRQAFFSKEKNYEKYQLIFIFAFCPLLLLSFYKGELPEYYFFFQMPAFILLTADLLAGKIKIFDKIWLFGLLLVYLIYLGRWDFIFVSKVNTASLFYKQKTMNYILDEAGNKDFKINYDMELSNQVGFNYFLKLKNKSSNNKADLEFVIIYPFIAEKAVLVDEAFGAYGVKKTE